MVTELALFIISTWHKSLIEQRFESEKENEADRLLWSEEPYRSVMNAPGHRFWARPDVLSRRDRSHILGLVFLMRVNEQLYGTSQLARLGPGNQ